MSTQNFDTSPLQAYIERTLVSASPELLQAYLRRRGKAWDKDEQLFYIEELTFEICDRVLNSLATDFTLEGADAKTLELWERLKALVWDQVLTETRRLTQTKDQAAVILRLLLCRYRPELLA